MAQLSDFYAKSEYDFDVTITYNGSNPDISGDTVTLYLIKDGTVSLTKEANVSGGSGVASFSISSTDSNLTPWNYEYLIIWTTSAGKSYVLPMATTTVQIINNPI